MLNSDVQLKDLFLFCDIRIIISCLYVSRYVPNVKSDRMHKLYFCEPTHYITPNVCPFQEFTRGDILSVMSIWTSLP